MRNLAALLRESGTRFLISVPAKGLSWGVCARARPPVCECVGWGKGC